MATPNPFSWQLRVRFVDTDASGRIHYTAMLRFFEAAEIEFLRFLGFPYSTIETSRTSYPRVHIECDYTKPVRHDDLLDISVYVDRVGSASFTLGFAARVRESAAAHGKITIVSMNVQTQKAQPLLPGLREALQAQLATG